MVFACGPDGVQPVDEPLSAEKEARVLVEEFARSKGYDPAQVGDGFFKGFEDAIAEGLRSGMTRETVMSRLKAVM